MKLFPLLATISVLFCVACSDKDKPEPPVEEIVCQFESQDDIVIEERGKKSFQLQLKANCDWTVEVSGGGEWLTVRLASGEGAAHLEGSGNTAIDFDVADFSGDADRRADVVLYDKNADEAGRVSVTQLISAVSCYVKFTGINVAYTPTPTSVDITLGTGEVLSGLDMNDGVVATNLYVGDRVHSARFYVEGENGKILVEWMDSAAGFLLGTTAPKSAPYEIALPKFYGGSGKSADPYLIANPRQLLNISNTGRMYFKLVADLDLEDACTIPGAPFYHDGYGWYGITLQGTLDGDGHTIRGIYEKRDWRYYDTAYMGLCQTAWGGTTFRNLTIRDMIQDSSEVTSMNAIAFAGAFVGMATTGTGPATDYHVIFENCHVENLEVDVYGREGGCAGGIIGAVYSPILIDKCTSKNVKIKSASNNFAWAGGLAGMLQYKSLVSGCRVVNAQLDAAKSGPIAGELLSDDVTITGCTIE